MSSSSILGFPTRDELQGTVQGTILYIFVFFALCCPFQAFSKFWLLRQKLVERNKKDAKKEIDFRAIKYYNSHDLLALIGDRWMGQFVEYSFSFLTLLWLHALFVPQGYQQSWTLCVIYTLSRSYYPLVFGGNVYPGVLASAIPNYAVLSYLMCKIGWHAFVTW